MNSENEENFGSPDPESEVKDEEGRPDPADEVVESNSGSPDPADEVQEISMPDEDPLPPLEVWEYYYTDDCKKALVVGLEDDGYVQVQFDGENNIKTVLYNSAWELLPFESVKREVKELRLGEGKLFSIKSKVANCIISCLNKHGFFAWHNGESYYFRKSDCKLFQVDSIDFQAIIEKNFGLNSTEAEYRYLIKRINTRAFDEKKVLVRKFCLYDRLSGNLYISRFDGRMYKLDGKYVELVPNGTDQILFMDDPIYEPYEYLGTNITGSLTELLVDPVNFSLSKDVLLTPDEQRALWSIDMYSIFFESLLPTKPITLFLGAKGAGKSSTLSWFLSTLFGSKMRVQSMGKDKEDAFISIICHDYIVVFDNVDGKITWLNDHLAAIATGAGIPRRQLYTTNTIIKLYPVVFIFLTSRTPKFKRDDVTDRLIIFNVETIPTYKSEEELKKERSDKRNEIWTEMLNDLNIIVKHFKEDDGSGFKTTHRMADWAKFAWRVCKIIGGEKELLSALEKLQQEQSEFLLEDEPIAQALELWIDLPGNEGKKVLAKDLLEELGDVYPALRNSYGTPKSLAQKLSHIDKNLKAFYETKSEKVDGKPIMYMFWRVK